MKFGKRFKIAQEGCHADAALAFLSYKDLKKALAADCQHEDALAPKFEQVCARLVAGRLSCLTPIRCAQLCAGRSCPVSTSFASYLAFNRTVNSFRDRFKRVRSPVCRWRAYIRIRREYLERAALLCGLTGPLR